MGTAMESLRATQMIGGNGERERRPTDLYPTPPNVTEGHHLWT